MSRPAVIDGVELVPPAPGRNLAPRAFTSRAVFDAEQRAIFARSWVHVADVRDVANPGDYATGTIGRTPVVIVHERSGGELRECPYRAWTYGLDGELLGVPCHDEVAGDVSETGLVPVRIGVVGPMILACIDPAAPDLAAWVGELPEAIARAGAAAWAPAYELRYEIEANWKLFVENANDGYDLPFVHDGLTAALAPDRGATVLEPHGAYTMALVDPAYVPAGRDPAETRIRFGCIFPNLIPVLSPSDLICLRVDPIAPDRLRLVVRSYERPGFEHLRELRKAALQQKIGQDIAVVRRRLRGLHAEGLPGGVRASRLEARIGHFERMWADAMAADADRGVERGRPTVRRGAEARADVY